MNQSELIEKVDRVTELNQAAAGQAVKAVVNAILDSLVAGEAVRVSGLGTFNVAARPARKGRNPQSGETIKIAASKAVRFHAGKAVKEASPATRESRMALTTAFTACPAAAWFSSRSYRPPMIAPESQVRTGLSAGGSWIRTSSSAPYRQRLKASRRSLDDLIGQQ